MTPLTTHELVRLLTNDSPHHAIQTPVTGISTDNRRVQKGDAFVAFVGERVDAHAFIDDAFDRGASVAIVTKPVKTDKGPVIQVQDPITAIQRLATRERQLFEGSVIGITGSNGKTTTKQMISAVLSGNQTDSCLYTEGNRNNELGLPLTILQRKPTHRSMVLEMGMRGMGEIEALCRIASPNIGVVTNIGQSHIERLRSQKNIALAKGELLESLPQDGFAILNKDDDWSDFLQTRTRSPIMWYGFSDEADVQARELEMTRQGMSFGVRWKDGITRMKIPTFGPHNVRNALAAVAVGQVMGIHIDDIASGLAHMEDIGGRLNVIDVTSSITVIDDCYNASPLSVQASLDILHDFPGNRPRIAILGDMYELGDYTEEGHRKIGSTAAKHHIDTLITVGKYAQFSADEAQKYGGVKNVVHYETVEEANADLFKWIGDEAIILVKASRGMQLEKLVQTLISS